MNLAEIPKSTISLVMDLPKEDRNKILKVAFGVLQQSPSQDYYEAFKKYLCDKNVAREEVYDILSMFVAMVKLFLETSDKEFRSKLLDLGFTNDFIEALQIIGNRDVIINNLCNSATTNFHNFSEVKWRIDISLSNSSLLGKVLPSVIIMLLLKNGKSYTIEVDAKTFHKLRFNIALILKELSGLQKYLHK